LNNLLIIIFSGCAANGRGYPKFASLRKRLRFLGEQIWWGRSPQGERSNPRSLRRAVAT